MKILVTGFDPFGGESVNPATEVVKMLPESINGIAEFYIKDRALEGFWENRKLLYGVASGKCGFHTLRAFSPLIPMVCRLFRYSKVYIVL